MIQSVQDSSGISEARRAADNFARGRGIGDAAAAKIALVATEMATNLVKYGGGGTIFLGEFADADGAGLELVALDQGAGMADVAACLRDGFSTSGSPGTGLGAIDRQCDHFAIYSRPGKGTIVIARFTKSAKPVSAARIGSLDQAAPGESVSGDRWAFSASGGPTLFMADGTGHGPEAAKAAEAAVTAFHANAHKDCGAIIETIHRALASTRGAAIAVARVEFGKNLVHFVGVGNISAAAVTSSRTQRMVTHNGTAGHIAPRIREFTYGFDEPPLIVMHSDGLSSRWTLEDYPGLAASHPAAVAAVLFRDHRRGRDDSLVTAMRQGP